MLLNHQRLCCCCCVQAVRLFGDQVKLWATFNEPVVSLAGSIVSYV
jgi:beta-glucosidase/6-phospho-beta-glucosidase/beta-galactosidase